MPPPPEWQIQTLSDLEVAHYSHLNLKLKKATLSAEANGIIGSSIRMKWDQDGKPIMSAYDKDGGGTSLKMLNKNLPYESGCM